MKRRSVLRGLVTGTLLLGLRRDILGGTDSPDLSLVQGQSPGALTREAIALLGGMQEFVSKGDVVLIKPNIAFDRAPEFAACTNPEVVKTLVEMCLEAGAARVKVFDNPVHSAALTFKRSGIAEVAALAGAEVVLPGRKDLKKANINGGWLTEWMIYNTVLENDKIINVPILKTHNISKLTMGMKNWLGACGGNRQQFHPTLDKVVVDLAAFFKPTLTILDAYRVLVRNGPQGGSSSYVKLFGTVVAGKDPVAVDTQGASFFGLKPSELRYLALAEERGLGTSNLSRLRIVQKVLG